MSMYQGRRNGTLEWAVYKDNTPFEHRRSQEIWNESSIGFAWGYAGLGPAKLALALLLDQNISEDRAFEHYQFFKRDVIARWDKDQEWQITSDEIMAWVWSYGDLDVSESPE